MLQLRAVHGVSKAGAKAATGGPPTHDDDDDDDDHDYEYPLA